MCLPSRWLRRRRGERGKTSVVGGARQIPGPFRRLRTNRSRGPERRGAGERWSRPERAGISCRAAPKGGVAVRGAQVTARAGSLAAPAHCRERGMACLRPQPLRHDRIHFHPVFCRGMPRQLWARSHCISAASPLAWWFVANAPHDVSAFKLDSDAGASHLHGRALWAIIERWLHWRPLLWADGPALPRKST